MNTNLGFKIRKIREIKNISQDYVAQKLGITQAAYSSIESGKTKVTNLKLEDIANILDVTPDVIKNYNESMIFNSCTQSGYINNQHINSFEKIQELYESIISLKNQLIDERDAKIIELERQLNDKNN